MLYAFVFFTIYFSIILFNAFSIMSRESDARHERLLKSKISFARKQRYIDRLRFQNLGMVSEIESLKDIRYKHQKNSLAPWCGENPAYVEINMRRVEKQIVTMMAAVEISDRERFMANMNPDEFTKHITIELYRIFMGAAMEKKIMRIRQDDASRRIIGEVMVAI